MLASDISVAVQLFLEQHNISVVGNCVMIKPSEVAPATAKFTANFLPKYIDNECCHVVLGGTTELLKHRFDYIFYTGTGSARVGQIIHQAANRYLTTVALELEPCSNMVKHGHGQTCVAPDYVLCTKEVENKFIEEARKALKMYCGENPQYCLSLGNIINARAMILVATILSVISFSIY